MPAKIHYLFNLRVTVSHTVTHDNGLNGRSYWHSLYIHTVQLLGEMFKKMKLHLVTVILKSVQFQSHFVKTKLFEGFLKPWSYTKIARKLFNFSNHSIFLNYFWARVCSTLYRCWFLLGLLHQCLTTTLTATPNYMRVVILFFPEFHIHKPKSSSFWGSDFSVHCWLVALQNPWLYVLSCCFGSSSHEGARRNFDGLLHHKAN